jgi:hypothetical protein
VIIPEVVSIGPAYVVVLDQAGNVLGYQSVADGVNRNVKVTLNGTPSSQWLYATLNKGGAVRSPWWKYPFVPILISLPMCSLIRELFLLTLEVGRRGWTLRAALAG